MEPRTRSLVRPVSWRAIGIAMQLIITYGLYARGCRSLGCPPFTKITTCSDERAGRWIGTSKGGGECGIHTRPLKADYQI